MTSRIAPQILVVLGCTVLASAPVAAQEPPVGEIVGYTDWGGIIRGDQLTHGQQGMSVSMGDLLRTAGPNGKIELRFIDDTKFVVGLNSEVLIDEFVFSGPQTASRLALQISKGAFRFVSGKSPSRAYSVETRTATLGFRGTAVDFSVQSHSAIAAVVYEGQAELCDRADRCIEIREPCGVGIADPAVGVRAVDDVAERNDLLRRHFPYVSDLQNRLRPDFRVDTDGCSMATIAPVEATADSLIGISGPGTASSSSQGAFGGTSSAGSTGGGGGNPGNSNDVGNAGNSPGGNDMGGGEKGASDKDGGGGGKGKN